MRTIKFSSLCILHTLKGFGVGTTETVSSNFWGSGLTNFTQTVQDTCSKLQEAAAMLGRAAAGGAVALCVTSVHLSIALLYSELLVNQ